MFENEQVGYLVGEVNAVDIDSGTFGLVEYSLSGPGATRYVIIHFVYSMNFEILMTAVLKSIQRLERSEPLLS